MGPPQLSISIIEATMPDPERVIRRQRALADFGEFALRNENLDEVLTEACRLVGEALERCSFRLSIPRVGEVVGALLVGELIEEFADGFPGLLDRTCRRLPKHSFQLGKGLLDGIEVRAVGREEEQVRACGPDRAPHVWALVAAQIVHHDDITASERRDQEPPHIGQEAAPIDRSVEHAWRGDRVTAQRSNERQRLPVSMRHLVDQAIPHSAATVRPGHVGLDPGLVDEDQPPRVKLVLVRPPA